MYAIPERGDSASEEHLARGSLGAALDRTAEGGQAKVIFSDRNSRGDMPSVARRSREKCDESARAQDAIWGVQAGKPGVD
jgi:hypothetical protein